MEVIDQSILIGAKVKLEADLKDLRNRHNVEEKDLINRSILALNPFSRGDIIKDNQNGTIIIYEKIRQIYQSSYLGAEPSCDICFYGEILKKDLTSRKIKTYGSVFLSRSVLVKAQPKDDVG